MILNLFYKNQCESSSERVFREACTIYTFLCSCVSWVSFWVLEWAMGQWDVGRSLWTIVFWLSYWSVHICCQWSNFTFIIHLTRTQLSLCVCLSVFCISVFVCLCTLLRLFHFEVCECVSGVCLCRCVWVWKCYCLSVWVWVAYSDHVIQ